MGSIYVVSEIVVFLLGMCISLTVCTLSSVKRQQQNMAQMTNNLRSQIQTYDRSLADCRRQMQLLTGRPQTATNQWMSGEDIINVKSSTT